MTLGDPTATSSDHSALTRMFVYGTLRPGDVRWPMLAPWVIGDPLDDTAVGALFDTGLGYPAAVFDSQQRSLTDRPGLIIGTVVELQPATLAEALEIIDAEEDTVAGSYRRIAITTTAGRLAWAYELGAGLDVTPIASGDWFAHSMPRH